MLEDMEMGTNQVTPTGLRAALEEFFHTHLEHLRMPLQPAELVAPLPATPTPTEFEWGGVSRRLPEGYKLPKGTVLDLFQAWCCVGPITDGVRVPALRKVEPVDFSDRAQRKRFLTLVCS